MAILKEDFLGCFEKSKRYWDDCVMFQRKVLWSGLRCHCSRKTIFLLILMTGYFPYKNNINFILSIWVWCLPFSDKDLSKFKAEMKNLSYFLNS